MEMILNFLVILSLRIVCVRMYSFQNPVVEKIWRQGCNEKSRVLNDCNWCVCNTKQQYVCQARLCNEVDMFGHFNDAIQDINVGMEGHGTWRSTETPCIPGVSYRRGTLLCVCNENGAWPNPVCKNKFQVLHSVETIESETSNSKSCDPYKLYLIGCQVCFCSATGEIQPELCTNHKCSQDDPVFKTDDEIDQDDGHVSELYAECRTGSKYNINYRTCRCERNNRLLCNDNTREDVTTDTYCSAKTAGEIFSIQCNICVCNDNGLMYCTTRKCLDKRTHILYSDIEALRDHESKDLYYDIDLNLMIDEENCIPGIIYKKECNFCSCIEVKSKKIMSCSLKKCTENTLRSRRELNNIINRIINDCVEDTVYEVDCLICRCDVINGEKWRSCAINKKCTNAIKGPQDLYFLSGRCQPYSVYDDECNNCRCMGNGYVHICEDNICKTSPTPLQVNIVPVTISNPKCREGHIYKLNCNYCVCLHNGNSLCTVMDCIKNDIL